MSDPKQTPDPSAAEPAADHDVAAPGGSAAQSSTAATEKAGVGAAQLEAIVKALQDEIAGLTDQNLRLRADMDNLRKRFEREKAETSKYAISKFAQDVVNVGDTFQRAITAVPAGAADQDPALKSFLDGVVLAEREFYIALERHGVQRLDPKGEPFNPRFHNAVMEQENPAVPAGTVLQVFQAGYMIEDRCLKPALVVVSRGGARGSRPQAQPQPEATADDRQSREEYGPSAHRNNGQQSGSSGGDA